MGGIGGMEQRPYSNAAYGISKVMLHYLVRKIHFEYENIVSFVADSGYIQRHFDVPRAKANHDPDRYGQ
jgi:norsolorinic acid ketoreductase